MYTDNALMRLFLALFLFIVSVPFAQAQTNVYQPYPLIDASWTTHTQYYNGSGITQEWVTEEWGGDINVNGITYTQVIGDPVIIGVRQDISNEKVYYIDNQNIEHEASFDQSAQLGDTLLLTEAFRTLAMNPWTSWSMWTGVDTVVVQQVDSLLIGPTYRKKFYLSGISFNNQYLYDCSYICGVGCDGYTTLEAGFTLECFYSEGAQYFGNPLNLNCTAAVDEWIAPPVAIFPNPAEDRFFIEYDQSATLHEIQLVDITGKLLTTFNKEHTAFGYDISNLPSGVYIVTFVFEQGTVRSTIVKS